MKKIFFLILILLSCVSMASSADNNGLEIRLIAPDQSESDAPEDVNVLMMKRLKKILRASGATLRDDFGHLNIAAKFANTSEDSEPEDPKNYSVATYLILEAQDGITDKTFASKAFRLRGTGADSKRAYLNAVGHMDRMAGDIRLFLQTAESRTLSGYDRNYKMYLEKARKAAERKDYRQALSCTAIIPARCKGAAEAEAATSLYYQKYIDKEGAKLLAEAKKILTGKADKDSAGKANHMLQSIDPASSSYAEAQSLLKQSGASASEAADNNTTDDSPTTFEKAKKVAVNYLNEQKGSARVLHIN